MDEDMIKDQQEYQITKAQVHKFVQAIHEFNATSVSDTTPTLRKAQLAAMESQLSDLCRELAEYDRLLA